MTLRASWSQQVFPDWANDEDRKDPRNAHTEYCHGFVVGPVIHPDGTLWLALLEGSKGKAVMLPATDVTLQHFVS